MLNKVVRARVLRSGNGTNKDSLTIVQFSGLIWRKNVRVAGSAAVSNLAQLKHFGKMKRLFLFWNKGTGGERKFSHWCKPFNKDKVLV